MVHMKKYGLSLVLICLALYHSLPLHAQIITTVAGGGGSTGSYVGDGGPATAATLNFPMGLFFDSVENLFICDNRNSCIRKISSSGIITTVAGIPTSFGFSGDGGPATAAHLYAPTDIAMDRIGNLYIADGPNFRIRKVDTAGIITTFAGNGTSGYAGDGSPATGAEIFGTAVTLAVDAIGNVYLSSAQSVRKVNTADIITTIAGSPTVSGFSGDGGPATAALLNGVESIAIDKIGNIYLDDRSNYRIRKIDTVGIIRTIAGNGTYGFSGDSGPATAAEISQVYGIFVDIAGNIYFTDQVGTERVRKISTFGIITSIAGNGTYSFSGDGGPATAAGFNVPAHVARFKGGNLYVSDRNNNRIRMVVDSNHVPHFCGGNTINFNVCTSFISVDSLLAVADIDTGQVEKWSLVTAPLHGAIVSAFNAITTGDTLFPTGLSFAPTPGYIGFDTIKVAVTDGYAYDTTTIYVRIDTSLPYAGIILSPGSEVTDSVCIGKILTLTNLTTGGLWSVSNTNASVSLGAVTGISIGRDTIRYIVTNGCGTDTATKVVAIKSCPSRIASPPSTSLKTGSQVTVWPNPNDGSFTLSLSSLTNEPAHITITNMVGDKVKEFTVATNTTVPVKLSTPAGVYFISAITGEGMYNAKVVVNPNH